MENSTVTKTQSPSRSEISQLDFSALDHFAKYRDLRRNPMFYNRFEKRKNTGAYMTWLMDEKDPAMPKNSFANAEKGPRIPFVKNDVDCVVNANILKLFSLVRAGFSEQKISSSEINSSRQDLLTNVEGERETCSLIEDMIEKDENHSCGVYYPNTYNLAFSLAHAKKAGLKCVSQNSYDLLIQKILKEQNADGSWTNQKNIWSDEILSTAFALTAILEYGDLGQNSVRTALFYGVHYLLNKIEIKNNLVSWPADNFFTATAIARSLIMWRSKAYTNTIIAAILLKVDKLYPEFHYQNFRNLSFNK